MTYLRIAGYYDNSRKASSYLSSFGNCFLVFSNFVEFGIEVIYKSLQEAEIQHASFTGTSTTASREALFDSFFYGKLQVLIVSPVGFEGLNLVGVTQVLVADPHFNTERTSQVIALATRAGFNTGSISVMHFRSVSELISENTVDEAIWRISQHKADVNRMISNLIKQGAAQEN